MGLGAAFGSFQEAHERLQEGTTRLRRRDIREIHEIRNIAYVMLGFLAVRKLMNTHFETQFNKLVGFRYVLLLSGMETVWEVHKLSVGHKTGF